MTLKVNIHILGLTKCTIYCKDNVPVFVPVFSMLLLCSSFRLKELFQVKNSLTMSLLFLKKKKAKSLGRSADDAKRRKKEDSLCFLLNSLTTTTLEIIVTKSLKQPHK